MLGIKSRLKSKILVLIKQRRTHRVCVCVCLDSTSDSVLLSEILQMVKSITI